MKNWLKTPFLSPEAACDEIADLTPRVFAEKDPRARIKLARRLAFAGSSIAFAPAFDDIKTIDAGVDALKLARRNGAVTEDMNRSLAALSRARLEIMGCLDAPVLGEAKKSVIVDSGCLACAGVDRLDPEIWASSNSATTLAAINRGDFFLIGIGGDGRVPVTLRIVDSPEPVLSPKEYTRLTDATEVGALRLDGHILRFGAPENLAAGAKLNAPAGLMKVQAFDLGRRVVLVACATTETPPPLAEIPTISA